MDSASGGSNRLNHGIYEVRHTDAQDQYLNHLAAETSAQLGIAIARECESTGNCMHTITRADLCASLQSATGFTFSRDAQEFLEYFFEEIALALVRGEEVSLQGFGKFRIIAKAARPGRNPRTMAPCTVCARRVVSFHPDLALIKNCQRT